MTRRNIALFAFALALPVTPMIMVEPADALPVKSVISYSNIVSDGGGNRCALLRLQRPDDGSHSWDLWYHRRMSC